MMELSKAYVIAEDLREKLQPYCERIEIAGSIRREHFEVKDIELVAIPKLEVIGSQLSLFDEPVNIIKPSSGFINTINGLQKVKGEPTGKYTQRMLPEGIKLDLFIAKPENWGNIFAMRTGSGEYSHRVLAKTWNQKGFVSKDGTLHMDDKPIPLYEEEELFDLLGLRWIHPSYREVDYDY